MPTLLRSHVLRMSAAPVTGLARGPRPWPMWMLWAAHLLSVFLAVVSALPESSDEEIASVCECLLLTAVRGRLNAPSGGGGGENDGDSECVAACGVWTNATACNADADCLWRNTARQNRLAAHSRTFNAPDILTVAPGVHVAIGYGLANVVVVVGPAGAILVDALESIEAGRTLRAALEPVLAGTPIVALILTHSHTDHTYGALGMVTAREASTLAVYAHASLPATLRESSMLTPATWHRSQRQFGNYLATGPDGHLNSGIGPALLYDNTTTPGYLRPTVLYTGPRLETQIAGVDVVLVHTPGETGDHTFVYLPGTGAAGTRVGVAGDNIYGAFPNLYTIRGTRARPLMTWYNSLDTIRDFAVDVLVPAHTRPLLSAADAADSLLHYRDAIQYVHDSTVRLLNLGIHADAVVDRVRLPPHLASHPFLQEFYGTVRWGVRAVIDYYLGWFSGRASTLDALPWRQQCARLVALAGGPDGAAEQARMALKEGTSDGLQWALQLAEAVFAVEPGHPLGRSVGVTAARQLGYQQTSANARNYYLSDAERLGGVPEYEPTLRQLAVSLAVLPLDNFLGQLQLHLDAAKSYAVGNLDVALVIAGDRTYVFRIRREVAELREYALDSDENVARVNLTVSTDEATFKRVVAGPGRLEAEVAAGLVLDPGPAEGGIELFELFYGMFQ